MELLSVTGTEHLYLPKNLKSLTREISLFFPQGSYSFVVEIGGNVKANEDRI